MAFLNISVASLSRSEAMLGQDTVTISIDAKDASYIHRIEYSFGGRWGIIASGVTDSCQWLPPLELARQIPNSTKGVCSIKCITMDAEGQVIGTGQALTLYLTVPQSVAPQVQHSWTDLSGAYDKLGMAVQNLSRLAVEVTAEGAQGSSVVRTAVLLDGAAYSGAAITAAGEKTLVSTVTDSRGRKAGFSEILTVAPYAPPRLTLSASRCDENGNADDSGEYARITVTGQITQVNDKNTARLSLSYGYGEPKTVAVEPGQFTYTEVVEAPSVSTLPIQAVLSDALLSTPKEMVLSVGYATLDLLAGGRGIAIGTTATKEGFVCAMDAEFTGKISGNFLDLMYPVDSLYLSYSHISPAALFGGTWSRISNRFLWAAAETGEPGSTGGEQTHTLTVDEMPHHQHFYNTRTGGYALAAYRTEVNRYVTPTHDLQATNSDDGYTPTTFKGSGAAHNNMPPYIQISVWRRIA